MPKKSEILSDALDLCEYMARVRGIPNDYKIGRILEYIATARKELEALSEEARRA